LLEAVSPPFPVQFVWNIFLTSDALSFFQKINFYKSDY
jgi:hypothetical protein